MTTCLGKSYSFGLPRVPFVNRCQFMYLVISFGFEGRMWDLTVSVPDHCLSFNFDNLLILFKIAWWTSSGKELTSLFSACADLLYAIWILCVPFPYQLLGKEVKFDCIGS